MKHIKLSILFFILLFAINSYGQRFDGGLLLGFNGSQIDGDDDGGFNKLGVAAGAWIQTDLSNSFYLAMELKINQKGSRLVPTEKNGYEKFIIRLDYIDLPILVGYQFNKTLSAYVGGSYGYLFHKSFIDAYGKLEENVTPYLDDAEIGYFTGLKASFKNVINRPWAENITLDVRMQSSLFSINNKTTQIDENWYYGMYNRVLTTSIYIPIGTKSE